MKVAIDVRDLDLAKTGAKTVLEEYCRHLPEVSNEHEIIFLKPSSSGKLGDNYLSKIVEQVKFLFWKNVQLPFLAKVKGADIIFCSDYVVPFFKFGLRTAPIFHGTNFWEQSENYNSLWLFLINFIAVPAAKKSDAIITVSKFTKKRLIKILDFDESKVKVIPIADKKINSNGESNILSNLSINEPYILHVGVLEKRKNLTNLVNAYSIAKKYKKDFPKLVLVGQPAPKNKLDDSRNIERAIDRHNLKNDVVLTGYVSDEDLNTLYKNAHAYVFPSVYEGFGIPVLEAFSYGIPIAASNKTAIPEVVGDAGIYFDPRNVDAIKNALIKVTNDNDLREKIIRKGYERYKDYSWEKSSIKLIKVFEEIV